MPCSSIPRVPGVGSKSRVPDFFIAPPYLHLPIKPQRSLSIDVKRGDMRGANLPSYGTIRISSSRHCRCMSFT